MYKFGENRLRKQKFQIALFDEEMNLIQVVDVLTDDKVAQTQVPELVGKQVPFALVPNYGCHGYAKFKIDPASLNAL